jgi:adenosylcobyric acid synthase
MTAKSIMVQGTMSNAGKSVLAAGLCRIFHQDGLRVAPFKSQNMALNSFITREGLEMGRAQVVQAQAAGVEPSVRMNPILLKPQSDTGSQVIVNGEVRGVMPAADYFRYKKELVPEILRAYRSLAEEYDVIVLEGAGSPAEINLRQDDIVNMGMARMARSPVLLAGDIDRGGVFAALYGTLALLPPEERGMVKATVINKFRGDVEILRPGLSQLEELTGVPVAGVVPYLDLDIDDEDSLSPRLTGRGGSGGVDIAVIRLPRISNFTDFAPLESLPGAGVRYPASPKELGKPDLVILPGTKSTMADLLWLRQSGLESAIQKLASAGTPVLGICGGYQMLGRTLRDPLGVEGGGDLAGMGLLPVDTVFQGEKTRTRMSGGVLAGPDCFSALSGAPVEGYEIHMGTTTLEEGAAPFCRIAPLDGGEPREDGAVRGNIWGTYLHGVLDSGELLSRLWEGLARRKGLDPGEKVDFDPVRRREREYDKLADALRQSLDMDLIYRILEEGI